ncbi:cupin domain-containing protein [Microcoleus sp. LEGE 07076]|uniref:cupin domain-containing protein n=1 Tax=Microcoleus sp. LEGE 07076 TaxID=915322 RepID=UPI001D14B451|nr:cupin domain-containing protein [Microcoleus sp. LEGE 07076]
MLAVLQALDTLNESEIRALTEKLRASPELQSERAAFEVAVAAIAYTAPLVPVSPDLKHRLFQRIAEVSSTPAEEVSSEPVYDLSPNTKSPHFIRRGHDVKWKDFGVSGISIGRLFTDKKKREITCLLRLEPGSEFPRHRHAGVEEIFVLEGDLVVEGEVCYQGDYIRSVPGSTHSSITKDGCLLLIKSSFDNEMLT